MAASKPTVLILGGWSESLSQALLRHIFPSPPSLTTSLASHVRIVDKHLILPQANAFLAYTDKHTKEILKWGVAEGEGKGRVEFRQGNLLLPDPRKQAFTLPEAFGGPDKSYDYVFDLTAETDWDASEEVYLERTAKLAALLGKEAIAKPDGGPKAYVRNMWFIYKRDDEKACSDSDKDVKPFSLKGKWDHEGARALANVEGLKLAVTRMPMLYGPYSSYGFANYLAAAATYKYSGTKMELLWSPDLPLSTIHIDDWSSAITSTASWLASQSRSDALSKAGIDLLPARPLKVKSRLSSLTGPYDDDTPKTGGLCPKDKVVKACVLHLVGEVITQEQLLGILGQVFGIQTGFQNALISKLAAMDLKDTVEEIRDRHLEPWIEMLDSSTPPISNTPINPDLSAELCCGESINAVSTKLKDVIGFTPRYPHLTVEVAQEQLDSFTADNLFPNAPSKGKKK